MDRRINPFNELYVTETIRSDQFVRIFSPAIVRNVEALFLPGNVVLQGVQGSGKSMLLGLLKPEVRLAYVEAGERFPVPAQCSRFIGAGINLTRSRAIDFGQRPIEAARGSERDILPLYFGDFLNYWIVYDILATIERFSSSNSGTIASEIGIAASSDALDRFAREICCDRCWFGYLRNVRTYSELRTQISNRITEYWAFLNYNRDEVPREISESKTSVGEPVSRTSELLRSSGILAEDVQIFVRIDQYEELCRLEGLHKDYGPSYRTVVNKALGMRDPRVSYRIGTRRYAWQPENLQFFGTTGHLEEERNYKLIDLDLLLRRKENVRSWIFPKLAEDIFERRLKFAGYDISSSPKLLDAILGPGLSAEKKAQIYAGNAPVRAIKMELSWPEPWRRFLTELATTDPLGARLAEAWCRQAGKGRVMEEHRSDSLPWAAKPYWRKERLDHALMQIAGRCGQRMIWAGRDEVLELSGGNILVFVSICQRIWAAWVRTIREVETSDSSLPRIEPDVQALGIHEASTHWFQKLSEVPGGDSRQRFVGHLGGILERNMFNDLSLSYPGHNGFSVRLDELVTNSKAQAFLREAVDYGDLFEAPHTTKEKNRKPRMKWYLNPILSPHFKLPNAHTKEPAYVSIHEVWKWIVAAENLSSPQIDAARLGGPAPDDGQGVLDFFAGDTPNVER